MMAQGKIEVIEEHENKIRWYHIDKSTITSKLANFFLGAKCSSYEPYMIIFLLSIGLTPMQAGVIGGFRLVGTITGGIFWGFLADCKKQYRLVLAIVSAGSVITMGLQPLLSLWFGDKRNNVCPKKSHTELASKIFINETKKINTTMSMELFTDQNNNFLFYIMFAINVISKFFESAHFGFTDSGVMEKCRELPHKPDYGKQRMFLSVGWVAVILVSNIFVDYFPKSSISCYAAVFVTHGMFTIPFFIASFILYKGLKFETELVGTNKENVITICWKIFGVDTFIFMITIMIMGVGQSFYIGFTFLLLKEMKGPTVINGISIAASSSSAIIGFCFGSFFVQKLRGTWLATLVGCLSYVVRFTAMAYVENAWLIPLIQTLQFSCSGLHLYAAVIHIKKISPPQVRTTMYSLMNTIYFGAGFLLANVIGAEIYDKHNAKLLFKVASLITFAWSIIILCYLALKMRVSYTKKEDKFCDEKLLTI